MQINDDDDDDLESGAVLRWGRGQFVSPNLGLVPKCDVKHCLTNSKHQRDYRRKHDRFLAFKVRHNLCVSDRRSTPGPTGGAHDAPRPASQLGRGHPFVSPLPGLTAGEKVGVRNIHNIIRFDTIG